MKLEHTEHMRVNWVDTDASGLIHYTAALRYFEVPEHVLMRELFAGRGFMLPRVHVEADYRAALRYPDEFDCTCRLGAIGRSSVTWEYEIVRSDGVQAIVGRIVAAAVGEDGQKMEIPAEIRERLGL